MHDSYGTHAADMDVLSTCIRQAFVDIYEQDWVAGLQQDFQASAEWSGAALVEPPERGEFEVAEVLGSDWFFA